MFKELRAVREKHRGCEKERRAQDLLITELKTSLAQVTKDNLILRKKLQKKSKTGDTKDKKTLLRVEPVSSSWISPIDESITPIRHVIMSRRGEVISQDQLFD